MTEDSTHDYLAETAVTLARCFPALAERLRAVHVPRPDGRCAGCVTGAGLPPHWPCGPRALADLAVRHLPGRT